MRSLMMLLIIGVTPKLITSNMRLTRLDTLTPKAIVRVLTKQSSLCLEILVFLNKYTHVYIFYGLLIYKIL